MYISKLELNNIRCFENVIINFEDENGNCKGAVILGDNGMGKTTLLRSIAMSLCGESSASGLLDEIEGGWIRKNKNNGYIRLSIKSGEKQKTYSITTKFNKESGGADVLDEQIIEPGNEIQLDEIFLCGYGASRGIAGETQYSKYAAVDAVYSLFTVDSGYLQNPELCIRRIKDATNSDEILNKILIWIASALMLPKNSIKLDKNGLSISGVWGASMPVGAIADGHRATLTMICDLLGWALLYDSEIFKDELSGIIIIDEIEQHLHPKWQRKIVKLLMKIFPKLQFIITTHSPLIAGNAGKLFDNDIGSKLFYTKFADGKSEISEIEEKLGELDYDQILSSEAFGYILNKNSEVEALLRKASVLASKDKKTEDEELQYVKIKKKLSGLMFPKGKTIIERDVEKEYYMKLRAQVEEFNKILDGKNK